MYPYIVYSPIHITHQQRVAAALAIHRDAGVDLPRLRPMARAWNQFTAWFVASSVRRVRLQPPKAAPPRLLIMTLDGRMQLTYHDADDGQFVDEV